MAYLVDRPDTLKAEVNWEEELSLGEKQRLAMARLYFHKPDYVVLDECTSACAGVMEQRLYNRCKEMGITVITISVRAPVLGHFIPSLTTILRFAASSCSSSVPSENSHDRNWRCWVHHRRYFRGNQPEVSRCQQDSDPWERISQKISSHETCARR